MSLSPPPAPKFERFGTEFTRPNDAAVVAVDGYTGTGGGRGTIVVRVTSTTVKVVARLLPAGAPAPAQPDPNNLPAGFRVLTRDPVHTTRFSDDAFPVTDLPQSPVPTAANRQLHVWGFPAVATDPVEHAVVTFLAMPNPVLVEVSAKHCLWYTYADDGLTRPHGETTPAYKPPFVPLPVEMTSATVARDPSDAGTWTHWVGGPAEAQTGPAGYGGNVGLDPNYAGEYFQENPSDVLHSSGIVGTPLPFNRLVGLWEYGARETSTTELDLIGTPTQPLPPGARPKALRLGFHDSFEWSNNDGVVRVLVSWS